MKLPRKKAAFLRETIQEWKQAGLLAEPQAEQLLQSIAVQTFDWRRLAKYAFWMALASFFISVTAALAEEWLAELLKRIFDAPAAVKSIGFAAVAAWLYWRGLQQRALHPAMRYRNEAIMFLGVASTAGSIHQLGVALDTGSGHFSLLLLLSFLVYAALGLWFESNLIWVFALVSLGSWMGTETGYVSGWGAYYLGMNYPLRFLLFGGILTGAALSLENHPIGQRFFRSTLTMGLLYLFIALWLLSIFGNYGDMHAWERAKQIELFHWSLLFGLVACGAIYHGLRCDNSITKGFGLTFLFINLYTRFFEYFWEPLHKAIVFALLGLSFWYLGTKAEKIWNLGKTPPH